MFTCYKFIIIFNLDKVRTWDDDSLIQQILFTILTCGRDSCMANSWALLVAGDVGCASGRGGALVSGQGLLEIMVAC